MPRWKPVDPETANGRTRNVLDAVRSKIGMVPNIVRGMATSPAVAEAYHAFSSALGSGTLSPKLRERIALMVAEANQCDYCLAAHSAVGRMVGLSQEEILDSRRATSPDRNTEAALRFARTLVSERGWVSDDDLARVRAAGYGDGEIAEIVANVALNLFTNYFNHVADTAVDFPAAPTLE